MRFDLVTLDLFIAVVEQQSISRAAEREHIATSAVSRRMSELEAMLRVNLFTRHSKGIELTAAGEALLRHARAIRGLVGQMEVELHEYERGLRGLIRIAANKSAILQFLPDDLSAFLATNPLVRIDLEEAISPGIIRAVAESAADIGIYGGNIPAPDLQVLPYHEDELVAVVPVGHKLASAGSIGFVALVENEFVCLERGSSIETLCQTAAGELGRILKPRVRVGGFDAQLRMIEAGLGVGVVPRRVAARGPHANLVLLALEERWAWRQLSLCVRDAGELPMAAKMLVDHLTRAQDAKAA